MKRSHSPCSGGPSHSLWSQKCFCILERPGVCSSMGMMLLPSHTLSSSLGLMLGPAQHPSLQVTGASPACVAGVVCARQSGWTRLFTWLQWLLVVRAAWPEEKWFGGNTCRGIGFARAEAALLSGVPLGLWLQLHICGYLLPQTFLDGKFPGKVGPAAQDWWCPASDRASLGGASWPWLCPRTTRGPCLVHG